MYVYIIDHTLNKIGSRVGECLHCEQQCEGFGVHCGP